MSLEGRIAIDVAFSDSTSSTGTQSLKKISLVDSTPYTAGKVAVLAGTISTAGVSFNTQGPLSYRNASGEAVSFANVSRIAFLASRNSYCLDPSNGGSSTIRSNGNASVADWSPEGPTIDISADFTSGTASYTLVLYGT